MGKTNPKTIPLPHYIGHCPQCFDINGVKEERKNEKLNKTKTTEDHVLCLGLVLVNFVASYLEFPRYGCSDVSCSLA